MAATVVAECPKCAKKYRLQDAADAGKKIKCRGCGHVFVVPKPEAAAEDEWEEDDFAALGDDFGDEPPAKLPTPKKAKKKPKPEEKAEKPKEKKRKAAPRPKRGMSPALIGAAVVLLLMVAGGAMFLFGGKSEPMQAPTSFATFQHKDQEFQVDFPADKDWQKDDGGKAGSQSPPWAKTWKGDALIRVKTSVGASMIGDIAGSLGQGGPVPDELKPVMQVHEFLKESYSEDYSGYVEQPAVLVEGPGVEAARSEFTAKGSWGSKLRGYRASVLGGKYQFTVVCVCPEKDWEALRPAFDRAIATVR